LLASISHAPAVLTVLFWFYSYTRIYPYIVIHVIVPLSMITFNIREQFITFPTTWKKSKAMAFI
jgi:hypothetical protein